MADNEIEDFEDLEKSMREYEAAARANFREPKYSFGDVLRAAGGKASFVRNWIDRGTFTLDANEKRIGRKHRRFSYRDAIIISLAVELSRQGIVPSNAERASEMVSEIIEEGVGKISADLGSRSTVRLDFSVDPPVLANPDGPRVGIIIDVHRLQDRVARAFGMRITAGTEEDHRRVAAEMKRDGEGSDDEGQTK